MHYKLDIMGSMTKNRKRGAVLLLNWKMKPRVDVKVKLNPEMSANLQHQQLWGARFYLSAPSAAPGSTGFCFLSPCLSHLFLLHNHWF